MSREVSLSEVNISASVFEAWREIGEKIAEFLVRAGVEVEDIPDERIRLEEDGSLTVWVEVTLPNGGNFEPSMKIPPSQWHWVVNPN